MWPEQTVGRNRAEQCTCDVCRILPFDDGRGRRTGVVVNSVRIWESPDTYLDRRERRADAPRIHPNPKTHNSILHRFQVPVQPRVGLARWFLAFAARCLLRFRGTLFFFFFAVVVVVRLQRIVLGGIILVAPAPFRSVPHHPPLAFFVRVVHPLSFSRPSHSEPVVKMPVRVGEIALLLGPPCGVGQRLRR